MCFIFFLYPYGLLSEIKDLLLLLLKLLSIIKFKLLNCISDAIQYQTIDIVSHVYFKHINLLFSKYIFSTSNSQSLRIYSFLGRVLMTPSSSSVNFTKNEKHGDN